MRRDDPEIGLDRLFSSALLRYVFYSAISLAGRSPTLPAPCPAEKYLTSFPISDAKVLQLSDMTKFFGEKMQKYVVKHKKEGFFTPPFHDLSHQTAQPYASKSGRS